MEQPIIEINKVKKKYVLGNIGTGTLTNDVRSWWAKIRKKADPNAPLLEETRRVGDEFMALNGVTFNVYKGEKIGIIGSNGAGKSTLLKILSRITSPTSGEVILRGKITSMLEVGTGFNPEMTGRENIYLNGAILGMTKSEIDAKIDQIIEFSEVSEFIDTPVKRYSSGMYVKLAFSVSAHLDSDVLIMDEVLAVGDAAFQKKCLDKMLQTANEQNRTIIFVSHSMPNIKKLCDRCILLTDGKITFDGDASEGIAYYSGMTFSRELRSVLHFIQTDDIENEISHAKFTKIQFLNSNDGFFNNKNQVDFSISVFAIKDVSELKFRVVLKSIDGEAVGMGIYLLGNLHEQQEKDFNFSFLIDNIANGKYYLDIYIGEFEGKIINNLDSKVNTLVFETCNSQNPYFKNWLVQPWGYFDLNLKGI